MNNLLDNITKLLSTYRGHDQTLSLIGYNCTMLAGLTKSEKKCVKLKNMASEISKARVVLRLLDDFSMLKYTLMYGLGKHVINYIDYIEIILKTM